MGGLRRGHDEPRRHARLARWSLVTRFAVLSLLIVLTIGAGLAVLLERSVSRRAISDAQRTATVAAQVGVAPALSAADLERGFAPLDAARRADLDERLGSVTSPNGVVGVTVWNREHWIVYSDERDLAGRWFPGTPELDAAFAGRVVSKVARPPYRTAGMADSGNVLAVYVPLRVGPDGRLTADPRVAVSGAFELFLPYAPIAAAIRSDILRLHLGLFAGLALLHLGVLRLVAKASRRLREQAQANLHQALYDGLTGLPNRTLFNERVDRALESAGRDGHSVAVMMIDLDRFKEINDTLGHTRGDELLQQVGQRLSGRLRGSDSVARLGGDEFALLLPVVPNAADARLVGLEMHRLLDAPFTVDGIELDIGGSIGIAVSPVHGQDAGTLMQHAEVAMYVAKAGHSHVELYDPTQDDHSAVRLELVAELRQALDEGQLTVHYQPKVEVAGRRVVGVEALVRWQHPERGLVSPGTFLPAIEHTELIRPLTDFVLETALAQAAAWRRRGWDIPVAVNLSARTVGDADLPGRVGRLLRHHGLPARALELELTESAVLANPRRAAQVLAELHGIGVHLAIDDFGSGYASVSYLTQFPITVLKVDQQFVRPVLHDEKAESIIRFTVGLGRTLNLTIVAEGVENEEIAEALEDLDCDVLQGYGIRAPGAAEELVPFFERWALSLAELV